MRIIEVLGALLIILIMTPALFNLWQSGFESVKKRQAADHLVMVNKAAAAYVRKHHADLATNCTGTSGPSVDVPTLVTEKLLTNGFSPRNIWGQAYQVYFRKTQGDDIQAIVLTTGGRGHDTREKDFANTTIPSTAAMAGGAGGFIPTGELPGQSGATLHGAFGGWVLDLGALSIPSPGAGHLGATSSFDTTSMGQDYLYRVAVPGHKELNAMQTELDMTDHALKRVKELHFVPRNISDESCTGADVQGRVFLDTTQGLYLCRNGFAEVIADTGNAAQVKQAVLAQNNDIIMKPSCPPGTGTVPQIFVSPSIAAAGYEAPPITALQAWATNLSATQWQVHLRLLTTDKNLDWVYPQPAYGRIMAVTMCAKELRP